MKSVAGRWNQFFFVPRSPVPIALFRILYGCLVIATLLLLRPDWLNWYGPHAWVSLGTQHQVEPGTRLNLFTVIPQSDAWVRALFRVFLAAAVLLTAGCLTRLNSVLVFVCLTSMDQRNLFITHGGDTFLRVAGFFLMLAPAGAALSIDRLVRIWRGKEGPAVPLVRPWPQRMIQFELSILYFATFCWKVQGTPWMEGSALYYVYHLDEMRRFPVPSWLLGPTLLKFGSWFAVALEFSLGTLIWIRKFRYYLLATGLLFHLIIEYSLNIPLFAWDILSGYILFVDGEDLARLRKRIGHALRQRIGRPVTVLYDRGSTRSERLANVLQVLDLFGYLRFLDVRTLNPQCEVPKGTGA